MTEFDTSRLPRSIQGWDTLLDHIEAAPGDAEIEKTWLELKSFPGLLKSEAKFAVAKAILAMANRDPVRAAEVMDGHGLVVVGAAAGQLIGTERVEDHVLLDQLAPYLGDASQTPSFDTKWILRDDKHILIIIVAPPGDGDKIYPLRREFDRYRSGTIFTRPSTKSEPADAAGVDMLAQRLTSAAAPFDVTITLAPDWLRHYSYDAAQLDAYLTAVETAYRRLVPGHRRPKPAPDHNSAVAQVGLSDTPSVKLGATSASIAGYLAAMEAAKPTISALESIKRVMPSPELAEDRDPEVYRAQVRGYCDQVGTAVPKMFGRLVALTQQEVSIAVTNNTDRYLEDVEVKIHVAGPVVAASAPQVDIDGALDRMLPTPARPWGPRPNPAHTLRNYAISPQRYSAPAPPPPAIPGPNTASFRTTGSVEAVLTLRNLRPSASHSLGSGVEETTVMMVTDRLLTETEVTVEVTAKGIDGICRQTITQPVAEPVDLTTDLLNALMRQLPRTIVASMGTASPSLADEDV